MEFLGDKLSVAHSHVTGWVVNVRRSLQGTLSAVSAASSRGEGNFKRTNSMRSLASRSRESFRRFSLRSQQRLSLLRRTASPDTPAAVKQHQHGEDEVKDTDTLVQESDSQYGTWETGLHTDDSLTSATPTSDSALSHSPGKLSPLHAPAYQGLTSEPVAPGGHFLPTPAESQTFSFPEVPTILLDTSALRSRAQLGKRRAPRSRPTRTTRQTPGPPEREGDAWRFRDYTDEKAENLQEDSDSKEQTRVVDPRSALAAVSQPQRIPLFPGMDPSALKSQLKRRSDSDTPGDGSTTSATQLSRSPKSPFLPRATRALPPPGGRENGLIDSPQWLKELKSKKRLSQYDNDDAK